jgi:hypothetical protein
LTNIGENMNTRVGPSFHFLRLLVQLTSLKLTNFDIGEGGIGHLKALETLELYSHTKNAHRFTSDAVVREISQCPLKNLVISRIQFDDTQCALLAIGLSGSLEYLDLYETSITINSLRLMQSFKKLTLLGLAGTQICLQDFVTCPYWFPHSIRKIFLTPINESDGTKSLFNKHVHLWKDYKVQIHC